MDELLKKINSFIFPFAFMTTSHVFILSNEFSISEEQVRTTVELLDEGATVPFISRYRKEMTQGLDEIQITNIRDRIQQLRDLDKRKESILRSIGEQGKLTDDVEKQVREASTLAILEDIYLPFKPKRRTRARIARERGLQPLADMLMDQGQVEPLVVAGSFIDETRDVATAVDALAGARDIVAEQVAEQVEVRTYARNILLIKGNFVSRVVPGKEEEAIKYKDYFEWSEPLKEAPSHRVLAMRRGEKEGLLYLDIVIDENEILPFILKKFVKDKGACGEQITLAIEDGYKRLLMPSMETEVRVLSRQRADQEAIRVFTDNARQLLLAAPLGQKRLIAIDPGFRTGCKTVVLDAQGNLLQNTTIFPHNGAGGRAEAETKLRKLITDYDVEAIAIGNGTAGRETEEFVKKLQLDILMVMVNESGASIYSASEVAREEFPKEDITVRGAVSIGRRLMDPLAELVKIDPKSIGVGQYQHDVDQRQLQTALDDTVISCVNAVGVELNTASKQILAYISGLGPALAQQIVNYRKENGPFRSRRELRKVPRLGEKAFEQAAGFLRIRHGDHPLDASAVHPERYGLVESMAADLDLSINDLIGNRELVKKIDLKKYVTARVGLPTLKDIVEELTKPGRDPREQFEAFAFADGINSLSDLSVGMWLPGVVTNITNFGAFIDIGVHQDGLVHLSQLADRYVEDPHQIVKVQQRVTVRVTEIDEKRKRIGLSMKTGIKAITKKRKNNNKSSKTTSEGDMAAKMAALVSKFR